MPGVSQLRGVGKKNAPFVDTHLDDLVAAATPTSCFLPKVHPASESKHPLAVLGLASRQPLRRPRRRIGRREEPQSLSGTRSVRIHPPVRMLHRVDGKRLRRSEGRRMGYGSGRERARGGGERGHGSALRESRARREEDVRVRRTAFRTESLDSLPAPSVPFEDLPEPLNRSFVLPARPRQPRHLELEDPRLVAVREMRREAGEVDGGVGEGGRQGGGFGEDVSAFLLAT